MTRRLRQFEINGIYHIVNRGVDKRSIFLKRQDYSRFVLGLEFFNNEESINIWNAVIKGKQDIRLKIEEQRKKQRNPIVEVLAFVLMPNHYHLILREIEEGGISSFMKKMGGYASYFNQQHDRSGALFQSRYKSIHVQSDAQLNNVFVYVHTNPIELKERSWKDFIVQDYDRAMKFLNDYNWSSYFNYVGDSKFPTVIKGDFFTEFYGDKDKCKKSISDWVKFKAENAELGNEIIE